MNSLNIHRVKEITTRIRTFDGVVWRDIKITTDTEVFEICLFTNKEELENLELKVLET
jgi:hypothetical protein